MDEHARKLIEAAQNGGGVPGGAGLAGPPREMVNLQQPDGSMVTIPIEQAVLHLIMEIRQIVTDVRAMVVGAEVVAMEAEEVAREASADATDDEATG